MVRVAVLHEEVLVDGVGHHARLQPAEPLEEEVVRRDPPHRHGVVEIDILGRRFLMEIKCAQISSQHCRFLVYIHIYTTANVVDS